MVAGAADGPIIDEANARLKVRRRVRRNYRGLIAANRMCTVRAIKVLRKSLARVCLRK